MHRGYASGGLKPGCIERKAGSSAIPTTWRKRAEIQRCQQAGWRWGQSGAKGSLACDDKSSFFVLSRSEVRGIILRVGVVQLDRLDAPLFLSR